MLVNAGVGWFQCRDGNIGKQEASVSDNWDSGGAVERLKQAREQISDELSQVIVGQQEVIEQILISIFSRGHCLLSWLRSALPTVGELQAIPNANV